MNTDPTNRLPLTPITVQPSQPKTGSLKSLGRPLSPTQENTVELFQNNINKNTDNPFPKGLSTTSRLRFLPGNTSTNRHLNSINTVGLSTLSKELEVKNCNLGTYTDLGEQIPSNYLFSVIRDNSKNDYDIRELLHQIKTNHTNEKPWDGLDWQRPPITFNESELKEIIKTNNNLSQSEKIEGLNFSDLIKKMKQTKPLNKKEKESLGKILSELKNKMKSTQTTDQKMDSIRNIFETINQISSKRDAELLLNLKDRVTGQTLEDIKNALNNTTEETCIKDLFSPVKNIVNDYSSQYSPGAISLGEISEENEVEEEE